MSRDLKLLKGSRWKEGRREEVVEEEEVVGNVCARASRNQGPRRIQVDPDFPHRYTAHCASNFLLIIRLLNQVEHHGPVV